MYSGRKEVIVYGLGKDFEDFRKTIEAEYQVVGYSDTDIDKANRYSPFIAVDEIREKENHVLITSTKYFDEIKASLIAKGIGEDRIEEGGLERLIQKPVLVVTIHAGMGNILFCYAFGQMLQEIHPEVPVYYDISWYFEINRPFARLLTHLEKMFHLSLPAADEETVKRAKRQGYTVQRESLVFEEKYFKINQGFFRGYWETSKYFSGVKEKIREKYQFDEAFLSAEQKNILEKIRNTESVAVWFRRGDYLAPENIGCFGNICTQEYYDKAMNYMKSRYKDAAFFIFSNDSEYIAEHYSEYNLMLYDDDTSDIKDYDMYLMSSCKHLIIANSTFSWWAAWLHGDKGTIIAPEKWLNEREDTDIWEEYWIKM